MFDDPHESQWLSNKNYIFLELIFEQKVPLSWPSKLHHWGYAILKQAVSVFLFFLLHILYKCYKIILA